MSRVTPKATSRIEKLRREIDEVNRQYSREEADRRAKRKQAKAGRRRNRKR